MKKQILDFTLQANRRLAAGYSLLQLSPSDGREITPVEPGQFVQVEVPDSKRTFLRRPISVNFVDRQANLLWLLVRNAGEGTRRLTELPEGRTLNLVLPLGRPFSMPEAGSERILLAGGGVGVAPMLFLGSKLKEAGFSPEFLLGARSEADLLELDEFRRYGDLHLSTDDGSAGEKGVVTQNSALQRRWDMIYCCGPMPMMKAVARYAARNNIACEVSLENKMACGVGACLCCVEDTDRGNVCVCKEGPVFNINRLKWGI